MTYKTWIKCLGVAGAIALVTAPTDSLAAHHRRKAHAAPPDSTAALNAAALAQSQTGAPATPGVNSPSGAQPAASQPVPGDTKISYGDILVLIRSSLISLQQANESGDYDIIYGLSSKGFQASNSVAKLKEAFAPMKPFNLSSILVLEPKFTRQPSLTGNGTLIMAGYFTSGNYNIVFQLAYSFEDKRWKLAGISAGVQPAGDSASSAASFSH